MPFDGTNDFKRADSGDPATYARFLSETPMSSPPPHKDALGWAEHNMLAPAANTLAIRPYNALANVVNAPWRFASGHDLLPKAESFSVAPAKIGSAEWFAQNISTGLSAAVLYTGIAKGTSKVLGAGGEALGSKGAALNWLAQSERSMVLGGTLYEGARDVQHGETRLGNMAGAAVGLGVFGFGNRYLSGLTGADLVAARYGLGAAGGMAWAGAADLASGRAPSLAQMGDAGFTGGVMNVMLPALMGDRGRVQSPAADTAGSIRMSIPSDIIPGRNLAMEGRPAFPMPEEVPASRVVPENPLPAGVDPTGVLTRTIPKPDGTTISLFSTGETVISKPGEPTVTRRPDGWIYREYADGRIEQMRPKSATPLEERPLNVASGAYENIGKQLSNFAHRPFLMDGLRYESVEGFYQGLKWPDAAKRAEIAQLAGPEAKSGGRGSPKVDSFEYGGRQMKFGSPEHHELVKRAIGESLRQNPDVLNAFMETHPRPIEHKTGRPENPRSAFPGSTFTRILTELRQEFVNERTQPATAGGDARERAVVPVEGEAPRSRPVSHLLGRIKDPYLRENHPLSHYQEAFKGFDRMGTEVVGGGYDSVNIKLADGNILKVSPRELPPDAGMRPFDLPILERGQATAADGYSVGYYIQPEAAPAPPEAFEPFVHRVGESGYVFLDPGVAQLGVYQGQVVLLDPWAVVKASH